MRSSDVTFKTVEAAIQSPNDNDNKRTMDVVEIKYPDGKVVAFPADQKSPETGIRYCDMWQGKYRAFKAGEPDPDRVAVLNREIEERQAELKALNAGKRESDWRVQDNLGYGKQQVGVDDETLRNSSALASEKVAEPSADKEVEQKTAEPERAKSDHKAGKKHKAA